MPKKPFYGLYVQSEVSEVGGPPTKSRSLDHLDRTNVQIQISDSGKARQGVVCGTQAGTTQDMPRLD